MSWWGGKVRQSWRHVSGRVSPQERAAVAAWLTPRQLALYDGMHPADRRHGLDVVAALRASGHEDPDLLLAGLLHDASKGPTVGLGPRVAWSLGERYGAWVWRLAAGLPGYPVAFDGLRDHAADSAQLALDAGCSAVTAELIRNQARPVDPVAGMALHLADEAS